MASSVYTVYCKLPGCNNLRYYDREHGLLDFCGKSHAEEHKKRELQRRLTSTTSTLNYLRRKTDTSSGLSSGKPMKAVHPSQLFSSTTLRPKSSIYFYDREDPFYEFTNFYPREIKLDGKVWPTTEHYFQAQKFVETPYFDYISHLPRPRDAFELCRHPVASKWVRGDWHQVKDDVMLKALMTKFSQHEDLKKQLLGTGKQKLVEHTWNDSYWGDGGDGKGKNRLGELLMQVRDLLRTAKTGDAPKHQTATRKLSGGRSLNTAEDDSYCVKENGTDTLHRHTHHLASPLTSRRRRTRSLSVDLGCFTSPGIFGARTYAEVATPSLPHGSRAHRMQDNQLSSYLPMDPSHSRLSSSLSSKSWYSPKGISPACSSYPSQASSLPSELSHYRLKHANVSSVNYNILHHPQ